MQILKSKGLKDRQLEDIRKLENICSEYEKLNMKLNWEMLNNRPTDGINDFLCYEEDKLIGFLGLYGFSPEPVEIEATGMVHPEYRGKGIFTTLFNKAKSECIARKVPKILLITERSSAPGLSFVRAINSQYGFSEFKMLFDKKTVPDFQKHGLTLRKVDASDLPWLINLDTLCFGSQEDESDGNYEFYKTTYAVEIENEPIGKIGLVMNKNSGYIFGLGLKPEYRGKGYGRELLSLGLLKLLSEKADKILLEVAVENEAALSLYKSCGFDVITIYDYFEIIL